MKKKNQGAFKSRKQNGGWARQQTILVRKWQQREDQDSGLRETVVNVVLVIEYSSLVPIAVIPIHAHSLESSSKESEA